MQGFEQVLKMMGIDPQKLVSDAQAMLDQFEERMKLRQDALLHEFQGLNEKLADMDKAIKKMDPDYVPDDFKSGDYLVVGEAEAQALTNPDMPDGGAVDMSTLDPERIPGSDTSPGPKIKAKAGA